MYKLDRKDAHLYSGLSPQNGNNTSILDVLTNKKKGNIYLANGLKVNHLGFKGSVGASIIDKQNVDNLRNWHYMWSSFYFYKKNYGYLYALKKMFVKFIRSLMKVIFFSLTFQNQKKNKIFI